MKKKPNGTSEDLCTEVRSIEAEESNRSSSLEQNTEISESMFVPTRLIKKFIAHSLARAGDPTDAIYVEVELRRLSFLKDTFSRGSKRIRLSCLLRGKIYIHLVGCGTQKKMICY
ncbi:hypothetical protein HYC85_007878 [Camellia sinensis]|uniref:NPK1-activating kinesin-like protein C-terminal domain-containing protein n=1 Tax=Camellia sinensis TaxID=4442 RepID=A0A7J7HQ63_CAMSI|nr:hypothetical protein HYC85_007878 [Camellia sinensis]